MRVTISEFLKKKQNPDFSYALSKALGMAASKGVKIRDLSISEDFDPRGWSIIIKGEG